MRLTPIDSTSQRPTVLLETLLYLDEEITKMILPSAVGYVYFIKAVETGLTKIGFTLDLKTRYRDLRRSTANSCTLLLETWVESDQSLEEELHHRFAAQRVKGEWFKTSRELSDLIWKYEFSRMEEETEAEMAELEASRSECSVQVAA
jgi:Meiotically up-regulated gene 113